jgi:hypothetical protein
LVLLNCLLWRNWSPRGKIAMLVAMLDHLPGKYCTGR